MSATYCNTVIGIQGTTISLLAASLLYAPTNSTAADDLTLRAIPELKLGILQTSYAIPEDTSSLEQLGIIHEFAAKILDNLEEPDPEFSKAVDENYWDLI